MAIASLLTAIGGLALSAFGMAKESEQAERINEQTMRTYGLEQAESKRRFEESLALQKRQMKEQRKEAQKAWRWKEDEREYGRAMDFVQNLNNMLNQDYALRQNLTRIWRR